MVNLSVMAPVAGYMRRHEVFCPQCAVKLYGANLPSLVVSPEDAGMLQCDLCGDLLTTTRRAESLRMQRADLAARAWSSSMARA